MSGNRPDVEIGLPVCGFLGADVTIVHGDKTNNLDKGTLHNSLKSSGMNPPDPEDLSGKFGCSAVPEQPVKLENVELSQKMAPVPHLSV